MQVTSHITGREIRTDGWAFVQLLFIGCYCILGCYQAGQILYDNLDDASFTASGEKYVRCLFENSISDHDRDAGLNACGEHPDERPALWRTILLITYASSIGILSFFVYGTQNKASRQVAETVNTIMSTTRSERGITVVRDGNSSSSKKVASGIEKTSSNLDKSSPRGQLKSKNSSRFEFDSQSAELESSAL